VGRFRECEGEVEQAGLSGLGGADGDVGGGGGSKDRC